MQERKYSPFVRKKVTETFFEEAWTGLIIHRL